MKKLHKFNNKFNQSKLSEKQLNSVKGGGWGNGGMVNNGKNCPPPDAGVWKRNSMG